MLSSQRFLRIIQWTCAITLTASLFQALTTSLFQAHVNDRSKYLEALHINASEDIELRVKRFDFPSDFAFGVSTSAPQIEGSAEEAGRGPSIWDNYIQNFPERILDRSNMSSIDWCKRYKEDVRALKDLRVNYFRFSISWSRILPKGTLCGGVSQEGIDYYNNLIDELLRNHITPFVTMLHFDLPQGLQDMHGGYLNRSFVDHFKDYSELCFKTFGDRVKHWITINEPVIISNLGYDSGIIPPARCSVGPGFACTGGNSATEPYIVSHNLLLAHATVVKLYRLKFQGKQGGQIGISHVGQYIEPYSESTQDKAAAKRILDFQIGWFMEPLVYGHYPKIMRDLVKDRLPTFTKKQKLLVQGSFDFIGISYYTTRFGKNDSECLVKPISYSKDVCALSLIENKDGIPIGPKAEGSVYIYSYPKGLQKLLELMKREYRSPRIFITENGISEANDNEKELDEALMDPHRIKSILRHLYMIKMAMKNGVNVKGYFYWTLFDCFEWVEGHIPRLGLYYIDYKDNRKRIPKESAKWLPKFLIGEA